MKVMIQGLNASTKSLSNGSKEPNKRKVRLLLVIVYSGTILACWQVWKKALTSKSLAQDHSSSGEWFVECHIEVKRQCKGLWEKVPTVATERTFTAQLLVT